ncbi:MAG: hypothetical protein HQK56_17345 [Deltaproteobacteria bacterium]|nr:hypothetical protein [Deltaproteobacteria bacterium]
MPRILFCWEIGGGLGHLFRILPLALEFRRRGHQVAAAIKSGSMGENLLRAHGIDVFSVTECRPPEKKFPLSQNYAQNLLRNGFWHRESLLSHLAAWLALFEAWPPDVVVAEHAPTALLAAGKAGLRRVAIGTGFTVPPLVSPMPGLQPWFSLAEDYLLKSENNFLDSVNPVLRELGASPLNSVADIFHGVAPVLCTFPELDHYGPRPDMRYWGPVIYTPPEIEPQWPSGGGDKIFLYLNPANKYCDRIIEVLKEMDLTVLAYLPEPAGADNARFEGTHLRITRLPVNLTAVAGQCRGMISQGGHNAGALMLLAGVPLLFCPMQLEQAVWAHRLCAQGLGGMVNYFDPEPDFRAKLTSFLARGAMFDCVGAFAAKYSAFDPAKQAAEIVDHCLSLVPSG